VNTWASSITTTSSSTTLPVFTTYQYDSGLLTVTPNQWTAPAIAPAPEPSSPLEWLDSEVEKTCALARAA
jgi:hypothetical protein